MRGTLWLLLIGLTLAGCTDDVAPTSEGDDPLDATDVIVETTADTGAIRGVVVDETITPIVGATVAVTGAELVETSDEKGAFAFSGLDPGVYFLAINATGHLPTQTSVRVEAEQVADARVQLARDLSPAPFHETLQFNGFIGLWAPGGSYAVQLLFQDDEVCRCQWQILPSANVSTFVYEAFWEASLEVPTLDQLSWELDSYEGDSLDHQEGEYSTAPIYAQLQRDLYSKASDNWLARITPGISAGVYVQQDYELFVTLFYLDAAPEGWSVNG